MILPSKKPNSNFNSVKKQNSTLEFEAKDISPQLALFRHKKENLIIPFFRRQPQIFIGTRRWGGRERRNCNPHSLSSLFWPFLYPSPLSPVSWISIPSYYVWVKKIGGGLESLTPPLSSPFLFFDPAGGSTMTPPYCRRWGVKREKMDHLLLLFFCSSAAKGQNSTIR